MLCIQCHKNKFICSFVDGSVLGSSGLEGSAILNICQAQTMTMIRAWLSCSCLFKKRIWREVRWNLFLTHWIRDAEQRNIFCKINKKSFNLNSQKIKIISQGWKLCAFLKSRLTDLAMSELLDASKDQDVWLVALSRTKVLIELTMFGKHLVSKLISCTSLWCEFFKCVLFSVFTSFRFKIISFNVMCYLLFRTDVFRLFRIFVIFHRAPLI